MSDNAATDGGRWRSARSDDAGRGECWRRVSGQVQLLVVGETRMQSSYNDVMAEERLVGSAALPNGAVGCRLVDGVVVVVVGEWCSRLVRRETSGVDERCLRQAAE